MNLEELKKVIREEVKKSMREELKDIIVEAVVIASTPDTSKKDTVYRPIQQPDTRSVRDQFKKLNPVEQMLEQTKLSFSSMDAQNFSPSAAINPMMNNTATAMAHNLGMIQNAPGLDINSLPFLKNAKTILDMSKQKDKERSGGN
jgi:hypothetical protein